MSLHVLVFVAKWKRQERRKIGSKGSMETPCSQLINRGTGLPRAGANSFPCGPAVHCCVQSSDLGLRRQEPGSNNPGFVLHMLHWFPGAFVTKNHRVGGLEQQKTSQ